MEALAYQHTPAIKTFTRDDVFAEVVDCFEEALGVEPEEVHMKAKVIDDLGEKSLDFLDIVFRLERAFDIKIPRGDVKAKSQKGLEGEFEIDGVLTPKALEKLREVMPEVDPSDIQDGLTVRDIPGLFLVETFVSICLQMLEERGALA